jgi:hypothetical protein
MFSVKCAVSAVVGLGVAAAAMAVWAGARPDSRRPVTDSRECAVPATAGTRQSSDQVLKAYAKLPVTFVENRGQTDKRVRYYAQGPRYAFYLTREEVVLSLAKGAGTSSAPRRQDASSKPRITTLATLRPGVPMVAHASAVTAPMTRGVDLHLRFVGSNPRVVVKGEERASGLVNYFRGNDSARWHAEIPHFAGVVYRELWPGVDLRLREQARALKYEFRVRPGARPATSRWPIAAQPV